MNGVLAWIAIIFIPFSFIMIFPDIPIWRWDLGRCLALPWWKTSTTLTFTSHDYGFLAQMAYFPHLLVQGNTCISHWAATGRASCAPYINISIIFVATGLWHGANWDFICWGVFHGFFMVLERLGLGKLLERNKSNQACLHDTGALCGLDLLPGGRRGAYAAVSEAHVPSLDVYGVRFCRCRSW